MKRKRANRRKSGNDMLAFWRQGGGEAEDGGHIEMFLVFRWKGRGGRKGSVPDWWCSKGAGIYGPSWTVYWAFHLPRLCVLDSTQAPYFHLQHRVGVDVLSPFLPPDSDWPLRSRLTSACWWGCLNLCQSVFWRLIWSASPCWLGTAVCLDCKERGTLSNGVRGKRKHC